MPDSWRELMGKGCINIAHRGARSLAPENTISAARKAIEAGAHAWELDVRMSADGKLVVVHDDTLVRTSNAPLLFPDRRPWNLRDFSLDEIRLLDFGSWFAEADPFGQIEKGAPKLEEVRRYRGEPAPTLEEALAFTAENHWFVNVEIKDLEGTPEHTSVAESVGRLVSAMGMRDRVLISSFNHEYLLRIKRVDRGLLTGVLVKSAQLSPAALAANLGVLTYNARVTALRPGQLEELASAGCRTLVWVVNNQRMMKFFIKARVAGIYTDFPQRLHVLLQS